MTTTAHPTGPHTAAHPREAGDSTAPHLAALTSARPHPPGRRAGATAGPARTAVLSGAAGLGAVAAALVAAPRVPDHPVLHEAALFAHLVALTLGFGAVLLIDVTGARWVLRRATLADVARLAGLAHPVIWVGVAGLVLSGALLHPDPTSSLTDTKLVAVVLLCANGGYATALSRDVSIAAVAGDRLARPLLVRTVASATTSQAAWWTTVVVGFLTTRR